MTDKVYKYDVFLSYSAADTQTVLEIANALRDSGLRIWLGEWIPHPAEDIAYQIKNALSNSRVLILFFSKGILEIQWRQMEKQTFKFRDPINPERRFIPVRLNDAVLPETLCQLEHLEWKAEQASEVLARLIAVCAPPEPKPTARGSAVTRISSRKRYRLNPPSPIRALNFQLFNRSAVYGTLEGTIHLMEIDDATRPKLTLSGHEGRIRSLELHLSKPLLLSSSVDCTVRLWDLESGQCLLVLSNDLGTVTSATFADDAIVTCSEDRFIQVWEDLGRDVPKDLRGHTGSVYSIKAIGNILVSAGADGTVRVWNLRSGQCSRVLEGHTGAVRCLSPNKNGTMLLSGSDDCTIRQWDLRSGLCLNTFDAHTDSVKDITWHADELAFVSGGGGSTPETLGHSVR